MSDDRVRVFTVERHVSSHICSREADAGNVQRVTWRAVKCLSTKTQALWKRSIFFFFFLLYSECNASLEHGTEPSSALFQMSFSQRSLPSLGSAVIINRRFGISYRHHLQGRTEEARNQLHVEFSCLVYSSIPKLKRYGFPKRRFPFNALHGVISYKTPEPPFIYSLTYILISNSTAQCNI
jgi:hypothetical protein